MPKAGGKVKEAVRASAGRPSAFESLHTLRRKHSVLGKKLTHKRRTTLQARARSDQIRRETLLVEHQQKDRANVFADGRFGEADEDMAPEDKLIQRFQRERQRQMRDSRFALADADDAPSSSCLLYTSPSPRDRQKSRMPSSA